MNTSKRIAMVLVLGLLTSTAAAYDYGWDPAKLQGGGMYCELAQNPTLIANGVYAGKYEYFFDFYLNGGDTFYYTGIHGLDNSKIANVHQLQPDGQTFKVQQWGQGPDSFHRQPGWSDSPGRIVDFWSAGSNADLIGATEDNFYRASYDDGAGGWADAGTGYPDASSNNPHSYSDYVRYSSGPDTLWKVEIVSPSTPVQWQLSGNWWGPPTADAVMVHGLNAWAGSWESGLTHTVRIVYDVPIDPLNIGWGTGLSLDYPVLGDFTLPGDDGRLGDFDDDGDIDADDIDALGAAVTAGSTDLAFDMDGDGDVDSDDFTMHVTTLVDTALGEGTGTAFGDFNLDGMVGILDLGLLGDGYNQASGWANGDANGDGSVGILDLGLLGDNYGYDGGAIPEPATMSLLGLGALALMRRRSR